MVEPTDQTTSMYQYRCVYLSGSSVSITFLVTFLAHPVTHNATTCCMLYTCINHNPHSLHHMNSIYSNKITKWAIAFWDPLHSLSQAWILIHQVALYTRTLSLTQTRLIFLYDHAHTYTHPATDCSLYHMTDKSKCCCLHYTNITLAVTHRDPATSVTILTWSWAILTILLQTEHKNVK